jgi:hypothetical protein
MAPVEALPDLVIYTLLIAVSIMLSLIVVFGGYHICCLRHNILTDDFDQHLMPCESILEREKYQPSMSVFEQDGLDSRYFGPPPPEPMQPQPQHAKPLKVNGQEETVPVSDSRYWRMTPPPPQLS